MRVISSTAKGRRVNCKQREITVMGNFWWIGGYKQELHMLWQGSSSVFNKTLNECVESMCTRQSG